MRPLVWSLVLKIFARFLEKGHCEREFDAALLTAHTLPIETLKQIEVNDCHIVPVEQLERAQHTRHFTFTCSQADLSRCHAVDALIGSSRFQCCNIIATASSCFPQRPHQVISSAAVPSRHRTEIRLYSGHGLPCCSLPQAILLLTSARFVAVEVHQHPAHSPPSHVGTAQIYCDQLIISLLFIPLFRSIIDRFLGKVVYKQEHSQGTDWLLLRLRR